MDYIFGLWTSTEEEMMVERNECGSPSCLVDRLEATITQQHRESMGFIEKLIDTNMGQITREMNDIKNTVKNDGDELFKRMRTVESDIVVLKTESGGVKWIRKYVIAPVAVLVMAGLILGALKFGLWVFDTQDASQNKSVQGQKR